jgi:ATP-dependent DNA helicase RecQ
MAKDIFEILNQYWGYTRFRPKQEEIIDSVLKGRDTLALMPTGGGKSITFQVPALAMEGMCLVITPLIALMRDQVQNLRKLEIPAAAIYSGMHYEEVDAVASGCLHNRYKFLYLSPERLAQENFQDFIARLNINLITVDEAHCISQWGYDFRPPYLKISEVRKLHPDVPILALTATATPAIAQDIMEKLHFKEPNIIRSSFERKNLSYNIFKENDKTAKLIRLLTKGKGPAVVYVRNRRKTRELADILVKNGISATFYHAGLQGNVRTKRQKDWTDGRVRVIVATNAFGMGIDKADVRQVIHYDLPDSLESYFQEAGRAGRDLKPAYASLLYNNKDLTDIKKRFQATFPPIETIKKVYNQLGNYFQIPVGAGENTGYTFDIGDFCRQYDLNVLETYSAIKLLEKEGFITYLESSGKYSKLKISLNNNHLYKYIVENPHDERIINEILRSYAGVFTDYVNINENLLSKRAGISREKVIESLKALHKKKVLSYIPIRVKPELIFNYQRIEAEYLQLSKENYEIRKNSAETRLVALLDFVTSGLQCRSVQLLRYFGEKHAHKCGICDVCRKEDKKPLNDHDVEAIKEKLKSMLSGEGKHLHEFMPELEEYDEDEVLSVIRCLLDNEQIIKQKDGTMKWYQQLDMEF